MYSEAVAASMILTSSLILSDLRFGQSAVDFCSCIGSCVRLGKLYGTWFYNFVILVACHHKAEKVRSDDDRVRAMFMIVWDSFHID